MDNCAARMPNLMPSSVRYYLTAPMRGDQLRCPGVTLSGAATKCAADLMGMPHSPHIIGTTRHFGYEASHILRAY